MVTRYHMEQVVWSTPSSCVLCSSFCEMYGEYVGTHRDHKFHSFPHLDLLVGVVSEATLHEMGFGYRAQ